MIWDTMVCMGVSLGFYEFWGSSVESVLSSTGKTCKFSTTVKEGMVWYD